MPQSRSAAVPQLPRAACFGPVLLQASSKTYFPATCSRRTRKAAKGSAEKRSVRVWTGQAGRSSCRGLLSRAGVLQDTTRPGEPGQDSKSRNTGLACLKKKRERERCLMLMSVREEDGQQIRRKGERSSREWEVERCGGRVDGRLIVVGAEDREWCEGRYACAHSEQS